MIQGIGTDIVHVPRLQRLWERWGEQALNRLLADEEKAACCVAIDKGRFLAKRFAAKEAFAKALGTGLRGHVVLPNLAIRHDELGRPFFYCAPPLAQQLAEQGLLTHLSLSDEADYVVAFVVMEKRQ